MAIDNSQKRRSALIDNSMLPTPDSSITPLDRMEMLGQYASQDEAPIPGGSSGVDGGEALYGGGFVMGLGMNISRG